MKSRMTYGLHTAVSNWRETWYHETMNILLDHFNLSFFIIEFNGVRQYGEGETRCILHQDQVTPGVYRTPHRKVWPPWHVYQGSPINTKQNADGHKDTLYQLGKTIKGAHCYISRTLILWYYVKGCLFYMDLLLHLKVIKTLSLENLHKCSYLFFTFI